jgi:NADH-ubiquinone oxidoreductase chain 4
LITPLIGVLIISLSNITIQEAKKIGLISSILTLTISFFIYILFDSSNIYYQFVQEVNQIKGTDIYLGVDGISIYFVLLTTIIMPLVLLSN